MKIDVKFSEDTTRINTKFGEVHETGRSPNGALEYYTTPREKINESHDEINTEYIWGLYRALMEEYPVKEKDYSIGELEQHAYVISTGERNTYGTLYAQYGEDAHIKKPKYLVLSGIHGTERKTALSTYRFIRDVLRGHNVPKAFKEGATICVMPVGTPSAFNAFERLNGDGVNINRDFSSDTPAIETQAIANWMKDNLDADLFIDVHNSGSVNEVVAILGAANNAVADMAKKIALRGVDRVIPFWKGYYPDKVESPYVIEDAEGNKKLATKKDADGKTVVDTKDMPYIFSYSVSANEKLDGTAFLYASEVLGIPSIAVELSTYYGDYSEWLNNKTAYPKETIAAGAEAIGNILIEFYEQSFLGEVKDDMKTMDSKVDTLLGAIPCNFRKVTGSFTPSEDTSIFEITGLPANIKRIEVRPDVDVGSLITDRVDGVTTITLIPVQYFTFSSNVQDEGRENEILPNSYVQYLYKTSTKSQLNGEANRVAIYDREAGTLRCDLSKRKATSEDTDVVDGLVEQDFKYRFVALTPKKAPVAGIPVTYNWIAYCWDD